MPASLPVVVVVVNQAWAVWKFRAGLLAFLRSAGYRVVVLTSRDDSFERLRPLCDELVDVPMVPNRVSIAADLALLARYRRELRRARPRAVLSFGIKPNIYASLVCAWLRIPVINNVTGLGTAGRRGGLMAALVHGLYRLALRRSHRVFFQNPADLSELVDQRLVTREQAYLLPGSGVDLDYYHPMRAPAQGEAVRFCMIARLLRDKGVVEFAEAAGIIRERHPSARFDLWGKLDAADPRSVTRAEIAEWERRGWLTFHGEARDARQAFADADVAVLPSYYHEGMPRSLLEAASMGLPCITTDMPGCRDAVVHGETGLVCAPRDVAALAAAMAQLIDAGRTRREAMGRGARARAESRFDEKIVLKAYASQLEQIHA